MAVQANTSHANLLQRLTARCSIPASAVCAGSGSRGRPRPQGFPLGSTRRATLDAAKADHRRLLVERDDDRLRPFGLAPTLADSITSVHTKQLDTSAKRLASVEKEKAYSRRWAGKLGQLRLNKPRPHHLSRHFTDLAADGYAGRSVNFNVIAIRSRSGPGDKHFAVSKRDSPLRALRAVEILLPHNVLSPTLAGITHADEQEDQKREHPTSQGRAARPVQGPGEQIVEALRLGLQLHRPNGDASRGKGQGLRVNREQTPPLNRPARSAFTSRRSRI